MFAQIPKGQGIWPAFWLLPFDRAVPHEIDILEALAADPRTAYFTIHTKDAKGATVQYGNFKKFDFEELSVGWHDMCSIGGRRSWPSTSTAIYCGFLPPTPPLLKRPCYIIANSAIGQANSWVDAPKPGTTWFDYLRIMSIRVEQRSEYVGAK